MSDFAWTPDYTITQSSEFKTLESESENGVKQFRALWPTGSKRWKLVFNKRSLAVLLAIQAFFDSKLGKATAFTWTNPLDSIEYTVRFASDSNPIDYESYQLGTVEIDFEEDTA